MRNLLLVLGDQLDLRSAVFDGADPSRDMVWMAEVDQEATHVWSHQLRIALFFSAMRHFRKACETKGFTVRYHALTENPLEDAGRPFKEILQKDILILQPERIRVVIPGNYRVLRQLQSACESLPVQLDILEDGHFLTRPDEFQSFSENRKAVRMEYFYRHLRKKFNILVDKDGQPVGGTWNFDILNRKTFPRTGPGTIPPLPSFPPDEISQEVCRLVERRYASHPGSTLFFDLPVTRDGALVLLEDFLEKRLPLFGPYQDAMWTGQPFLYHSRLSTALNLKLISPGECLQMVLEASRARDFPLASVEGFIRQILGWREFIRAVYWTTMPDYQDSNFFGHEAPLPRFYWHGETELVCVRETMAHVLRYAYSHHIHRLMVMGLLALLLGVHPKAFHQWHMAMYADAIDWVSLPNTVGMSQHADGGIVGSKPYCASGRYIQRMSNFCNICPYPKFAIFEGHFSETAQMSGTKFLKRGSAKTEISTVVAEYGKTY